MKVCTHSLTHLLTYSLFLKAASISGDYKEILSLYEYLKKSKLAVDTTHITHVIEAYAKLGQIDQVNDSLTYSFTNSLTHSFFRD